MSSAEATPLQNDTLDATARAENADLVRWQRRLLPFMMRFIVVLAIVFFGLSVFNLLQIGNFIEAEHGANIRTVIQEQVTKETSANSSPAPEQAFRQSLLLLEADALDRRYHQASAVLMSRIWTKQLAFITGMVMAFLGAIFILGKLSEGRSTISGGHSDWQTTISSSSPGIILSFFGTVLLVVALLVQTTISVQDSPVYVYGMALKQGGATTSATPPGADEKRLLIPPDILDAGKEKKPNSGAPQPKAEAPR
jgi:hypothetical protein